MDITEACSTDVGLVAARDASVSQIGDYKTPVAYALARRDAEGLVFGHVNKVGAVRDLQAAALALECGYSNVGGAFALTRAQVEAVVELLAPAEAATHVPHPNIWTWRQLLADGTARSEFVAFFLADAPEGPSSDEEAQFQALTTQQPSLPFHNPEK